MVAEIPLYVCCNLAKDEIFSGHLYNFELRFVIAFDYVSVRMLTFGRVKIVSDNNEN